MSGFSSRRRDHAGLRYLSDRSLLIEILLFLYDMESNIMATIGDLNNAVSDLKGNEDANDVRVAALVHAISDAASSSAARDNDMLAQIQTLKDVIAAGGDPAALQPAVDSLHEMAVQAKTQGEGLDAATSALAVAFPPPAPPASGGDTTGGAASTGNPNAETAPANPEAPAGAVEQAPANPDQP